MSRLGLLTLLAAVLFAVLAVRLTTSILAYYDAQRRELDCVFLATPQPVVMNMLDLADVDSEDLLYDLGCGDGRICILAAREYGCRAKGYELDRELIEQARAHARTAGVDHLVEIIDRDIYQVDLSEADVLALYLTEKMLEKLIPQFQQMRPGSRIVSHNYKIAGAVPDRMVSLRLPDDTTEHTVYLWTIPLRFAEGEGISGDQAEASPAAVDDSPPSLPGDQDDRDLLDPGQPPEPALR